MTFKDLENEGWIRFEDRDDLNKEISKKELCKIILSSYRNNLKYNKGNINKKLEERYKKLDNILRPLKIITHVLYFKNAKLESRSNSNEYNDFLIVKVKDEIELLLNVTTGEDLSINYQDNNLKVIDKVTKVKELYTFNPDNYQDDLEIGKIESVILYKNVDIQNSINNTTISLTDIIEIKDIKGTVFYIDILFNNIYKRNNIFNIKKYRNSKIYIMFKNRINNDFNIKLFNNIKLKMINMFYDIE